MVEGSFILGLDLTTDLTWFDITVICPRKTDFGLPSDWIESHVCRTLCLPFNINIRIYFHSLKHLIKTHWQGLFCFLRFKCQSLRRFKNTCRNKPSLTSHLLRSAVITLPWNCQDGLSRYTVKLNFILHPTPNLHLELKWDLHPDTDPILMQGVNRVRTFQGCESWSVIYHIIDLVNCWHFNMFTAGLQSLKANRW